MAAKRSDPRVVALAKRLGDQIASFNDRSPHGQRFKINSVYSRILANDPTRERSKLAKDERPTLNPGIIYLLDAAEKLGTTVGALVGEEPLSFTAEDRRRAAATITWLTDTFHVHNHQTPGVATQTGTVVAPSARLPERTVARWTPEFPIEPADFNESGDTDYPLELHAYEMEDLDVAAGVVGVENDEMTTVLSAKEVRDNKIRTVRVRGDSMSPTFEDGWKLAFDVTNQTPRDGDVVVAYRKDEGMMLGRWRRADATGGASLLKDNEEYDAVTLLPGDRVVGVVEYIVYQPVRRRRAR